MPSRRSLLQILLIAAGCSTGLFGQQVPMDQLKGLRPRSIGPAGMSGRVTAIGVVHRDPSVIYVGTASGGLWKSVSGGTVWTPIFDTMAVAAIGAIAIDQNAPDVVWVGTGEGNPRNSQTSGNGVYRTLDGGRSWQHLGLDGTRNIHRMILDPRDPNVAYAGAQGGAWGDSPDRGVYKTTDGGRSWKKILFVNSRTGVADLVMDPGNPNKLIAAMWEYRRWPWYMSSGGAGSGLYVSVDGGGTWHRRSREHGLPADPLGRIGLAIAPGDPRIVYALVESKKNGLYKSEDGGWSWRLVSDRNVGSRPFYYAELYVDPKNENRIYNLHSGVTISEDGGKTFEQLIEGIHPDHHAWWIDPMNPSVLIDGNDGGLAISRDRGKTWQFIGNLPLGQFYHINVDAGMPYHVYGGLQDNGSWYGPAYTWREGGIRNSDWEPTTFGDGFDVLPDRSDPRFGYSMSQGGNLYRFDRLTGAEKYIQPAHPAGLPLRFNWNAGIAHDPFGPTTIYYGSQFLHRSTDRGESWEIISPDLTTNDTLKLRQRTSGGLTFDVTGAENHCTIIAVAPSPAAKGTIWVGTDDGRLQLTRDGGKNWTDVRGSVRGVPDSTWIPHIHPSVRDGATAYVVFDNHRRDDWTPYLYVTRDFGKSWKRLAGPDQVWGYALTVVEDPVEQRLLFLGTEFGLYMSIDAGISWTKWREGFPTVSTMDLAIHPTEPDLVIGTFGRSIYILDDLTPLRILAKEGLPLLTRSLKVFPAPEARMVDTKSPAGILFPGSGEYQGTNRAMGARITFLVPQGKGGKSTIGTDRKDTATVEICDQSGAILRTIRTPAEPGFNRFSWDLRRKGERSALQERRGRNDQDPPGPRVLPGTYTVRVRLGKEQDSSWVTVSGDPRAEIPVAAMKAKDATREHLLALTRSVNAATERLREMKKGAERVRELLTGKDTASAIAKLGKEVLDSVSAIMGVLTEPEAQGIRSNPDLIPVLIGRASGYLGSSWDEPNANERIVLARADEGVRRFLQRVNAFAGGVWGRYRKGVEEARLPLLIESPPIEIPSTR